MKVEIRLEKPQDHRQVEFVVREAFWNVYAPGCTEHYLIHIMRPSPNFVSQLDFVAVADNKIVGSVVFLKGKILGDDGASYEDVLSLGPIAVLPSYQRKGIGHMLVNQAKIEAARMGYRAILLCGDPQYYSKLGFKPAEIFGIRTAENKYFDALQVLPLYEGALNGISGRYFEDEIYLVDEEKAKLFDQQFPAKELVFGNKSQQRFLEFLSKQKDFI